MIIFHEGLPRSGKSYECVVYQIMPAIKAGRKVYSNIKGLDHAKIAEVMELDLELVQSLLIQIEWEDTKKIHTLVTNDALVCIDEVQDFWPSKASQKDKMTNEMQQFVTQHGHLGLDIVLMGQDMRDVDPIWRRRVSQKITYVKLDAVGKDNSYSWNNYKATAPERFSKTSNGVKKYDTKYFGTYASHRPETTNTANKQDDRSNILKSASFRYALPAAFCAAIFAGWWLYGFFTHPTALGVKASAPVSAEAKAIAETARKIDEQNRVGSQPAQAHAPVVQTPPQKPSLDYVQTITETARPRLSGIVISGTGAMGGLIEWLDESFRVRESLTFGQLIEMGYTIKPITNAVYLIDPAGKQTLVTSWPIDPFGRVSNIQSEAVGKSGKVSL